MACFFSSVLCCISAISNVEGAEGNRKLSTSALFALKQHVPAIESRVLVHSFICRLERSQTCEWKIVVWKKMDVQILQSLPSFTYRTVDDLMRRYPQYCTALCVCDCVLFCFVSVCIHFISLLYAVCSRNHMYHIGIYFFT